MTLSELKDALENTNEVELTVTGRRSGREISNPVWFVQEEDTLYLVPVRGSDGDWYRNVLKTPTIRLAADVAESTATATPITDAAKVGDVVDKFREKYGADQVRQYYSKLDAAVSVPLA
jgi:deazaflavin-dependent oxidoreductase (nitroreductase family)